MGIKQISGYIIIVLFALILIEVLTSGVLGGMNSEFWIISGIATFAIVVGIFVFNWKGVKKAILPINSHSENMYGCAKNMIENHEATAAEMNLDYDSKKFIKPMKARISLNIKDKYFLQYTGNDNLTKNVLYDPASGKNIGFIDGTAMHGIAEEVVPKISKILDIISENKKEVVVAAPTQEPQKK